MPAPPSARLTPTEALAQLRSPSGVEDLAADLGSEALVVEGDWSELPPQADPGWLERLRDQPAVTVAVVRSPLGPGGAVMAAGFDVVLVDTAGAPQVDGAAPAAALASVLDAVGTNPTASLVLAQLLRAGAGGHAGLLAESLAYGLLQGGPEHAAWLAAQARRPAPEASSPAVRAERSGARLDVVLNRPEVRNALDTAMRDALVEVLAAAGADPTVAEIVLRGEGPAFSSGGALWEFGTVPDPITGHVVRSTRLPARAVAGVAGRLRAQVHGPCVGAGVELPAFAARVEAAPGTTFRLPEAGMGLVPGSGGTVSLPRRIGRQRTAFLALTGQEIDVDTALEWGLVDAIS